MRTLRRGRRTSVGASISTNMTAALARGGASSVRTTRRVSYAATDISGIADAVCAVTRMSCVCSEISGTAEAIRSVAHTARIAATEGTSALVRSLSAHAGLATTNARTDKLIGTARLTVSVGRAVIQVGRVLPVLNTEKIVIVPIRRETIGVPRIVRLSRRLPIARNSVFRFEVVTLQSSVGAAAVRTTCGFDRMVLAVGNLVGITGFDIHMIQALLVAASVRIDLVRRGTEIVARTGKYLVRIDGLLLRNSLSRCTALTHTVVAHGSSGGAASSTVARSPAVRASNGSAGGRGTRCRGTMSASRRRSGSGCTMCARRGGAGGGCAMSTGRGCAGSGCTMCAGRGCAGSGCAMCARRGGAGSGGTMSTSRRCAGSGCAMCASRGCAGRRGSVGASRGRCGVT
ncbi:hypothetical protein HMPREF1137_1634 [Actinomyces sp. ICM39]|nr:hypothetical protein HMPREF1137_1634 [Actinomyces sp. ICM39]